MRHLLLGCVASIVIASPVLAQLTTDFRVKSDFRNPDNGAWGANESVGNADFRVHSRFAAVYYGGVQRHDDFTFTVQIDFRAISGFAANFPASPYNSNFDVYINNAFVGRALMSTATPGLATVTYKSRQPVAPELPVPANWPSPIEVGSTVRVFAAGATAPQIADPLPTVGTPIYTSTLEEKWARGDANHDGHVNSADFAVLAANFDPAGLGGARIGPTRGDFTGDNRCDIADYNMLVLNWDAGGTPPAAPVACLGLPTGNAANVNGCRSGSATFSVTAVGTGPFTYMWRKNGVNNSLFTNASSRTPTLTLSNLQTASAGSYDCLITNACGSVGSASATLSVCAADFNCSGVTNTQDIFDYLAAWFAGSSTADINLTGGVNVQDIFDFLSTWFAGC